MNNDKINRLMIIFNSITNTIMGLIISLFCTSIITNTSDNFTKVIIIPFLICGDAILIKGIVTLFQGFKMLKSRKNIRNEIEDIEQKITKINHITTKLYTIGFSIFWFVFLIVFDYLAIKEWQNDGSTLFFFSFIFWIAGIFIVVKNFKK